MAAASLAARPSMTSSMLTSAGVAFAQGWAMSMIVTGGGVEPVGGAGGGGLELYPPPPPPQAHSSVASRAISSRRVPMPAVYGGVARETERTEAYSAPPSAGQGVRLNP